MEATIGKLFTLASRQSANAMRVAAFRLNAQPFILNDDTPSPLLVATLIRSQTSQTERFAALGHAESHGATLASVPLGSSRERPMMTTRTITLGRAAEVKRHLNQ